MVNALVIDIKRIYEDFHKNEIDTSTFLMCYSAVEHILLDLGYCFEVFTNDIREQPFNTLSIHFVRGLKDIVAQFTTGLCPTREVYLSVHKFNKSLLIVVR